MDRDDAYYEAMRTRDHRFDGKFFVGVKTTGIYCRPICPAKPKRENVEFFRSSFQAESAGYRPCLRCRPESAPRSPAWIGSSALVRRALKVLQGPGAFELNEDDFAARFGVSARHLRRLFAAEIGKTPKQIAFEGRLNLARKLVIETGLPLAEISFAAGFGSVRRFNDAFKERFRRKPSELRRTKPEGRSVLRLSLSYRPPFDFQGLLDHYRSHRVASLECFDDRSMARVIEFGGAVGSISVTDQPETSSVLVVVDFPETRELQSILARVRDFFDLDSDPVVLANAFERSPGLRKLLRAHPGIRLPSGWDPFETAIGVILGQLVSVERGRALVDDLVCLTGEETLIPGWPEPVRLFPRPERLARANLSKLRTSVARRRTISQFSRAVAEGRISLDPTQHIDAFMEAVRAIPGIGPWSASAMALRCLRHTDAFPEKDLVLLREMKRLPPGALDQVRPWRGYAAALYWSAARRSKKISRGRRQ